MVGYPYHHLGNWNAIKTEISLSNVIQRDSVLFARKLGIEEFAKETEEEVNI